jgi:hypothetical protein
MTRRCACATSRPAAHHRRSAYGTATDPAEAGYDVKTVEQAPQPPPDPGTPAAAGTRQARAHRRRRPGLLVGTPAFCAPPADNAAEITDPPGGSRCRCGSSWPHRYGGASRVRKSIVLPDCWAGGPGTSALREGGRTGSLDECTMRACGSAVTGPAASAGLARFAPSGIALAAEAPQRAIPGTAAGLRGDDLAGWDQVPAPVVPFPVRASDRN